MSAVTEFDARIYEALTVIPRGRVVTYTDIARYVKNPRAARAVGNALNRNPHAPRVPCHRVVRSDGSVGGYAFGSKKKIEILQGEGVVVKNNTVDLEKFRYFFEK